MKLMSLVRNFDQLSDSPQLFFKGKSRYESFVGGIITLILYALAAAGFGYFSIGMLYHEDPFFTTSTVCLNKTEYVLNTSETIVAFMVADYSGFPVETEGMIEIKGEAIEYFADEISGTYGETQIKWYTLNFTKCGEIKLHSTIYNRLYKDFADLNTYICLSPNQLIEIKNHFNYPYSSYINVYFTRCYNKTNCKSNEEIDRNFQYFSINSILTDYYTNGNDYLEPITPFRNIFYDHVSTYSFKRKYINLQQIDFKSDDGWIMPNKQNYKFPSIRDTRETFKLSEVFYEDIGSMIYQWTLSFPSDGLNTQYSRTYVKIQDIFANVGGLIQALQIGSYILMYFYLDIFNTTCIFDNFVLISKQDQSYLKTNSFKKIGDNEPASRNNFIIPSEKPRLFEVMGKSKKKMDFNSSYNLSLFYRRLFCFCCNKHHPIYTIYEKSKDLIYNKYFDVINLIDMKNKLDFISNYVFKDKREILNEFEHLSQIVIYDKIHQRISRADITNFFINNIKPN